MNAPELRPVQATPRWSDAGLPRRAVRRAALAAEPGWSGGLGTPEAPARQAGRAQPPGGAQTPTAPNAVAAPARREAVETVADVGTLNTDGRSNLALNIDRAPFGCRDAAALGGDREFAEVQRRLKVPARPFDEPSVRAADAAFPPDRAQPLEVSCSS